MTTPTATSSETTAKKDVSKLQRAIVDGLEDVKAQDIQVFNTEHLTALFERVIVASGTSNRQTKALAASVRDAVRDAGFAKPRMEGEENGEWIIVDCGAAVVHIMQPTIRQYYRLEELWGEKPVRLKLGAPKPAAPAAAKVPAKTAARRAAKAEAEAIESGQTTAPKAPAKAAVKAVGRKPTARKPTRPAVEEPIETPKPAARKTAAKAPAKVAATKTAVKTATKTAVKTPIKTLVVKPRAEKSPAKKAAPRTGIKPVRKTTASIDAADAVKTTKAPARKPTARKA